MKPDKILYEIGMTATGGREGYVTGPGLDEPMKLSLPKSMGGSGSDGTNPEKLFASGYAACFLGAVKFVARGRKIALPEDVSVTATIGIGPIEVGYALTAKLEVAMPGIDHDLAVDIVEAAHQRCPYSNATRGNIEVELVVV